jgi:hypothetical protein
VHRRQGRNWGLEEEARRLKQGAHRYRRQEALARRNRLRERDVLVEQLNKEQPSDYSLPYLYSPNLLEGGFSEVSEARTTTHRGQGCLAAPGAR